MHRTRPSAEGTPLSRLAWPLWSLTAVQGFLSAPEKMSCAGIRSDYASGSGETATAIVRCGGRTWRVEARSVRCAVREKGADEAYSGFGRS